MIPSVIECDDAIVVVTHASIEVRLGLEGKLQALYGMDEAEAWRLGRALLQAADRFPPVSAQPPKQSTVVDETE